MIVAAVVGFSSDTGISKIDVVIESVGEIRSRRA